MLNIETYEEKIEKINENENETGKEKLINKEKDEIINIEEYEKEKNEIINK